MEGRGRRSGSGFTSEKRSVQTRHRSGARIVELCGSAHRDYANRRVATSPTLSMGRRRVQGPRAARLVLRRCREHLDDGHDPEVILDQLEILRRIPSPAAERPVRRT